jgi:hypothetical protein
MRRAGTTTVLLAAAMLVGCGGPSAQERLTRWQSQTDATCRQVEARVADRRRPADARDLDRVVTRAVTDVRAAMREVAGRPLPEGFEDRVRPFVDAVRGVEPRLDELLSAGEFLDETRLLVAVDKVQKPANELERHARRAGLSDCARDGFADRVSDALLTPLFVQKFNKIQAGLHRDFAAFAKDRRVTPDHRVTFFDVHEHLFGPRRRPARSPSGAAARARRRAARPAPARRSVPSREIHAQRHRLSHGDDAAHVNGARGVAR